MQRICLSLVLGLVLVGTADAQKGGGKTKYTVDVTISGSGLVTSSTGGISCPGACSTSVNSGTAITFTATPDPGATFSGWGGDCAGTSTTCSLTISAPTSVSAAFEGGGGGGGPTVEELQARIEALEALVADLSASLNGIETQFAGVSRSIDPLTDRDTIFFDAVNIVVRNKIGGGFSPNNGLGNIILGNNVKDTNTECLEGLVGGRNGSHNLILGGCNSYDGVGSIVGGGGNGSMGGGIVFGYYNSGGQGASIFSGRWNHALNQGVVINGEYNFADGRAVTVGGENNGSSGSSVVVGGEFNASNGHVTVTVGGYANGALNGYPVGSDPGNSVIVGGHNIYSCVRMGFCGQGIVDPPDPNY